MGTPGTFVLRSADDAIQVRAFAQLNLAEHGVVAGGGLLGLEAAYALHKLGLQTTVLERSDRLLRRQLDERAAGLLHRYLEGLGISVWTGAETVDMSHNGRLGEIVLKDGRAAQAEVLIAAAGITPNVELAKQAGLETARGVIVDDHMRTSDERIFAAGDVAEFAGQVAGLWPAAVEQARVAAEAAVLVSDTSLPGDRARDGTEGRRGRSDIDGRDRAQFSVDEVLVQEDKDALRYGKLVISEGHIVGAILIGYSKEVAYVTSAVKQGWDVTPVLDELREERWDALERLGRGRSL